MAQLYEGWMIGASEINSNDANKRKAAKILGENFEVFSEQDAYDAINNVRLVTHGDNQNFFGLNRNFKGVTGNSLYSKMVDVYDGLGYIEGRAPNWRLISYSGIVEEANLTGRQHAAEEAKSFAPVSTEDKTKEALASKEVTINFSTGNATLDENAKYIIDRDFVGIAKAFGNSRIRIEGNTDNTGSRELNVSLSRRRAQAVADYLISEHNMPRNRLIVVGNGPDQPVASNNTESGRAKNRRTDFELVSE
jgi:NitT/TauT family transport system substrate-binding protein